MKEVVSLSPEQTNWEDVLALITRSFEYMDVIIDPPTSAKRLTAEILKEKSGTNHVFGIFRDGKPVACIFCEPRNDCLYIGKLAIDLDMQGQGFGRKLMARAEALAQTLDYSTVELQVRVELDQNRAYFEHLGYVKTGETAHEGFTRSTSNTFRKWLD